jgi:hypothetical protein
MDISHRIKKYYSHTYADLIEQQERRRVRFRIALGAVALFLFAIYIIFDESIYNALSGHIKNQILMYILIAAALILLQWISAAFLDKLFSSNAAQERNNLGYTLSSLSSAQLVQCLSHDGHVLFLRGRTRIASARSIRRAFINDVNADPLSYSLFGWNQGLVFSLVSTSIVIAYSALGEVTILLGALVAL